MSDLPVNKKTATRLNTYDVLKKRLENKLWLKQSRRMFDKKWNY